MPGCAAAEHTNEWPKCGPGRVARDQQMNMVGHEAVRNDCELVLASTVQQCRYRSPSELIGVEHACALVRETGNEIAPSPRVAEFPESRGHRGGESNARSQGRRPPPS